MEESLFIEYVQKWFPGILQGVVETLNDTKNALTYRHRTLLRREYSVSGKWESINVANNRVAADIVAMDSDLPLKKRDSYGKAGGEIPKMGMKFRLNERQMKDLDTLISMGGREQQIVQALFRDTPKAILGVAERLEALTLQGLSTGVVLVDDEDDASIGIRLDYGYVSENQIGVKALWSDATNGKPWDDLETLFAKASADGNTITNIFLDRTALNWLFASEQSKGLYAFNSGFVGGIDAIPNLDIDKINAVGQSRLGANFQLIDRSVKIEKNGVQTAFKPWADGRVVLTGRDQVGSLVYTDLAEMNHPVAGVTYQTADEFILVSQYRQNTPSLSEWTSSQAMVLPVIGNVDEIYTIDTKTVEA